MSSPEQENKPSPTPTELKEQEIMKKEGESRKVPLQREEVSRLGRTFKED